jgi:hypothetical protein
VTALLKKVHMYVGLLNFSILAVFGIAGIEATLRGGALFERQWSPPRYEPFAPPPNASDAAVAELAFQQLRLPLTNSLPGFALRRNNQNALVLDFYHVNGLHRVTVLESAQQLKVESSRVSVSQFLNNLHTHTARGPHAHWALRLWGWYNEFAIWSLLGMVVSGLYLWLASRPSLRWAQAMFAVGAGGFAILYFLTR